MLYNCKIKDVDHRPKFIVSCGDRTYEGDSATGKSSLNVFDSCRLFTAQNLEAWSEVVMAVEKIRASADALRFFAKGVQGETLFGLNESAITKITESVRFISAEVN